MFHTSILTKKDYLSEFEEKDQALEKLQSGPDKAIRSMDDSAVTRYDQYKTGSYVNTAMYMGTNSTSYYFSVANGNISRFFDEMYLNTPWDYHYSSLDGRSILDRLASVKYFAIKKADMGICHTAMTVKQKSQKNTVSTKTRIPFLLVIPMIPGSPEKSMKSFL